MTIQPSRFWCIWQSLKGSNRTHLTTTDVPPVDLANKWIIITGANSGIGREAALTFASWGANVVLACRDVPDNTINNEPHPSTVVSECITKAHEAGHTNSHIIWHEVDFARLDTVKAFADWWNTTTFSSSSSKRDNLPSPSPSPPHLDILCNNAGISSNQTVTLTEDGFELVHQVNFLAHAYLTLLLLPSLAKAPEPRIVCTTSCLSYVARFHEGINPHNGLAVIPPDGGNQNAYPINKLFFQVWLCELQRRLRLCVPRVGADGGDHQGQQGQRQRYDRIVVNGVHPGYVNTGIFTSGNVTSSQLSWRNNFPALLMKKLAALVAIDAYQGSLAIVHAAVGPAAGLEAGGGGKYFNRIWEQENMPHTRDPESMSMVWNMVVKELKLTETGLLDGLGGE